MNVIIMRGLPGSGKSTWIQEQVIGRIVCSADDYHVGTDGVYRFDPGRAAQAHADCLRKFLLHLRTGSFVHLIVDNTNTTAWEIAPYYQAALAFGHKPKIIRMHCTFEEACFRNVHSVPVETIWRMQQNLLHERLPAHWAEEIILPIWLKRP